MRLSHFHTNIVLITKNEKIVYQNQDCVDLDTSSLTDRSIMNVKDIIDFSGSVELSEVEELLQRQIEYNTSIAVEGINGNWGANIGRLARDGMRETDKEIIRIMLEE